MVGEQQHQIKGCENTILELKVADRVHSRSNCAHDFVAHKGWKKAGNRTVATGDH